LKHDICVITGGKPLHIDRPRAERLVAAGTAEWLGKRSIRFVTDRQQRGASPFPEFRESVGDTAHWVNARRLAPRMDEDKRSFLRAMRQLT
jgi:hypothetical protein